MAPPMLITAPWRTLDYLQAVYVVYLDYASLLQEFCVDLCVYILILFLNLYMFADPATCGTYTTRNGNVYLQQIPAYELVYPVRPNLNVYQQ